MSEALIGVLIGGLIASLVPLAKLVFEFLKWTSERRVKRLQAERQRLTEVSAKISDMLHKAIVEDNYPVDLIANMIFQCPQKVTYLLGDMVRDKDRSIDTLRKYCHKIQTGMAEALADVEKKIESSF